MSDPEEEIYSIIFKTLKHPARRKILRMLAEKPKNFTRILEELGVSSSHLTYHIENLGELLTKRDDGKYVLSSFGRAAVATMRDVEETPNIKPAQGLALTWQWKSFFAVLMVAVVVLASISYVQFTALNTLASEHEQLVADFNQLSEEHNQMLSWGLSTDRVVHFLEDVIQLDMTKYHAQLERNTVEYRSDLGGVIEDVLTYTLTSNEGKLDADFRFRNQTLFRYRIDVIEGAPTFAALQPQNIVEQVEGILQRYQTYAGASYVEPMAEMLGAVDGIHDMETVADDIKLVVSTDGGETQFKWMYTTNDIDFQAKELTFNFDNGVLETLTDGWFLFSIGNAELNVSHQEAIEIAIDNIQGFAWSAEGTVVTDYVIVEENATALLWPHTRDNTLKLYPYWYVSLPLDKTYPGNINYIAIGVWGDTGDITTYTPRSTR